MCDDSGVTGVAEGNPNILCLDRGSNLGPESNSSPYSYALRNKTKRSREAWCVVIDIRGRACRMPESISFLFPHLSCRDFWSSSQRRPSSAMLRRDQRFCLHHHPDDGGSNHVRSAGPHGARRARRQPSSVFFLLETQEARAQPRVKSDCLSKQN